MTSLLTEFGYLSCVRYSGKWKLRKGRAWDDQRGGRLSHEEDERGWKSFVVILGMETLNHFSYNYQNATIHYKCAKTGQHSVQVQNLDQMLGICHFIGVKCWYMSFFSFKDRVGQPMKAFWIIGFVRIFRFMKYLIYHWPRIRGHDILDLPSFFRPVHTTVVTVSPLCFFPFYWVTKS